MSEAILEGALLGVRSRVRTTYEQIERLPAPEGVPDDAELHRPVPVSTSQRAQRIREERERRIEAVELHVVTEVSYGDGRHVVCNCGVAFAGRSDGAMAKSFDLHVYHARVERFDERHRAS
jgi:hypothetical protein